MISDRKKQRQVLYWRLMDQLFSNDEARNLQEMSADVLNEIDLPHVLLDGDVSINNVCQRYPKLKKDFEEVMTDSEDDLEVSNVDEDAEVKRAAIFGKLMVNIFGKVSNGTVSAKEYSEWCEDVGWFEQACGFAPGQLRGRGPGHGNDESFSEDLKNMEGDIIKRMKLREVLNDDRLAEKLTPSMSLLDQLLRDKSNLSGTALKNAKRLIKKYVDQVAQVLKTQVEQASVGEIDRSVPPKRIFRNLDLKKTVWKNLVNWNPKDEKLYVDQLFFQQTSRKNTPSRMIVVVDQSGSMVDAMVNCAILASIFAGLPKVDVHLIAFDTEAIDLTQWIKDPFEVLLRTNLGGGNDGPVAMEMAQPKIHDPNNTVMVWISDFYEFDRSQPLFNMIKAVKESGVKFIPVGSVSSSGYQSIDPWFKKRLKELGCPVISGSMKKLIVELKKFLT